MFQPPPLPRTLDAAFRDLKSTQSTIRAEAIADVARHVGATPHARDAALREFVTLLTDASAGVRAAAAVALGDIGAREALPAILVAVEDVDGHVRQMAINALGELGDARAAPRLLRALRDDRPDVRYQAIVAYPRVLRADDAEVTRALVAAMADADPAVRYIAIRVAEDWLDGPEAHRASAGDDLLPELVAALRGALGDGEAKVVLAAAILLAKLSAPDGKGVLLEVIRRGTVGGVRPEKEDEQAAVELAGALGLREVAPALERRAWGVGAMLRDTCAWHAKIALAGLGHPRAVAEIERDLASARREVVEAAVVAAGRAPVPGARPLLERLTAAAADPELVKEALDRMTRAGSLCRSVAGRVSRSGS